MNLVAAYFKEMQDYDYYEIPDKAFALYRVVENELHFGHMYVKPEHRHEGLAQTLGDAVCEIAKDKGCTYASCIVSLPDKSPEKATRLVRIYTEFGYTIVDLVGNSQIIMKKDLI